MTLPVRDTALSRTPPRRYAMNIPRTTPTTKLKVREIDTKNAVQGRAYDKTEDTLVDLLIKEWPRSPTRMFLTYLTNFSQIG